MKVSLPRAARLSFAAILTILAFHPAEGSTAARGATVADHSSPRAAKDDGCAGFRFTARLDHRRWRFIVTGIRVPARGVTCTAVKKAIKQLIRTHSVASLQCEASRPAWDAEDHAYWSGYCLYPDGRKTAWQVEEYQLT